MKASKIYTAQEMREMADAIINECEYEEAGLVYESPAKSGHIFYPDEASAMLRQAANMCERCDEVKDKAMHLWRASLINRRRSFRIQVEVAAQDYDNAVARAKCINPECVEVEWCRKILSFPN